MRLSFFRQEASTNYTVACQVSVSETILAVKQFGYSFVATINCQKKLLFVNGLMRFIPDFIPANNCSPYVINSSIVNFRRKIYLVFLQSLLVSLSACYHIVSMHMILICLCSTGMVELKNCCCIMLVANGNSFHIWK